MTELDLAPEGAETPVTAAELASSVQAFTFGDPEAVLDRRELFDMFETTHNSKWYEPPIPMVQLGRTFRMSPHHSSAILMKRNMLAGAFIPSRWLSRADFSRWVLDWLIFGNAYLERIDNMASRPMRLKPTPAAYTRVGVEPDTFWFIRPNALIGQAFPFAAGTVHQLIEPDPMQEIYGQPEYLSALQAGLLNEAATIFRRRYYKNGSHAGYIFYVAEAGLTTTDSDAIRKAMKDAKGPGNFRNMFLHIPNGKKDGVQVIPISSVEAKDEFMNIKDVTRDDMLAAHRVPPQMLGVVPKNAGGFGSMSDAANNFFEQEIMPIQQRLLEVNDWLGMKAVEFTPFVPRSSPGAAPKSGG